MGITGVRMFVRGKEPTTIAHMVDHIDHVARLIGIEHVGVGSDADLQGYDDMPPDQYEMLKAGYKARYAFRRSEEHTSELQSLMRISYAVFCLKKKNNNTYKQY